MRVSLLFSFLLLSFSVSFSQVGNEWINFGQIYYKIPVGKDGLYRVTKNDLAQAGFPVSLDPRRYQIFCKGIEQARNIVGQEDAVFNDADFIEFYGKRNDGSLDAELYKPSTDQPHKYHNLYNDTTYYFLTFNPTTQGKRMETFSQANVANLPKETYHEATQLQVLTNSYSGGEVFNGAVQYTHFNKGEGWSGDLKRENTFVDVSVTGITNAVVSQGLPTLQLQLLGRDSESHRAQILVGPSTGALRVLTTVDFFGFQPFTLNSPLAWADVSAGGNLIVRVNVLGTGGPDFLSVSYARVQLPQNFSMSSVNEKLFTLIENPGNKSYIEIENPPANARIFDITDSNNLLQIGTSLTTTLNAVVNNTQVENRKLFVTNQVITPNNIKPVTFRSFSSANAEYLIITHNAFKKPAVGVANPVKAYAEYRASSQGGGYDTLSVTIDQLYNQFTYGESTPLAIFRFLQFLESRKRPDYLFIIGRGLDVDNNYYRNPTSSNFAVLKDFVPSAGYPASDANYSAGLGGGDVNEPAIPTGRLSATLPEHVVFYLNKVKEMEATSFNDLWRKRILHLSGGIEPGEPERFKGYVEYFASVATDVYLGGDVKGIAKRSSVQGELINISEEVNAGLNLITFFGHSSTSTSDFDIGYVTNPVLGYNNKGRYPMMLINGCNAGAFFTKNIVLYGEDWINASEKGATGFIAHTSFALESSLRRYSDFFYEVAYGDSTYLKKGIGDIQKEVARRYLDGVFASPQNITQVQQMLLLGDPAVKLFGATKTDFSIENSAVTAVAPDGKTITTTTPNFNLRIVVKNFGRAEPTPLRISVKRTLPDNSVQTYDSLFAPVFNTDTLLFPISNANAVAGTNSFEIFIDSDLTFNELSESNNTVLFTLFVPRSGTKNLFPTNFAIVNSTSNTLTFQSANLADSLRSFVLEIDTTNTFSSTYKKQFIIEAEVLVQKEFELLLTDSLTYYWRTRLLNPSAEENADWEQNSFTYIVNGNDGWGQLHFPQFNSNAFTDLVADQALRKLTFAESKMPILIKTFGDLNTAPFSDVSVKIDGAEYNLATQSPLQGCRDNTINLIAFNKTNNVPYEAIPFTFQDQRSCGREPQVIISFNASEVYNNGSRDLIDYINNVVVGDSVVLFTIGNPNFSAWNPQAVAKLNELGVSASDFASFVNGEPIVIFGKKGATNALILKSSLSPAIEQELIVNRQLTSRSASGTMLSDKIGPAKTWGVAKYNIDALSNDLTQVDLLGVNATGGEEVIQTDISAFADISAIDPLMYPYLRLRYTSEDVVDLTSAQLSYWLVEFESLPEGITLFDGFELPVNATTQTLQEGQSFTAAFKFSNISTVAFADSLAVEIRVINQNTNETELKSLKIKAPLPNEATVFSTNITTINRAGANDVTVNINSVGAIPELYLDNNVLSFSNAFTVLDDTFSPSLSVLVDGRRLQNADFVSASPVVDITIRDENNALLKTDTLGVRILLQYPCFEDCVPTTINFSNPDVEWFAQTPTTPFQVLFNPKSLADGIYTLQVFAEDAKGNESGVEPYAISFQVRNEQSVVISKPYPNPTSGAFTFEVSLTGSVLPAKAELIILSTTGRELQKVNLSADALHIGKNYTTQQLQLSPGLYLYQLQVDGLVERGTIVINGN